MVSQTATLIKDNIFNKNTVHYNNVSDYTETLYTLPQFESVDNIESKIESQDVGRIMFVKSSVLTAHINMHVTSKNKFATCLAMYLQKCEPVTTLVSSLSSVLESAKLEVNVTPEESVLIIEAKQQCEVLNVDSDPASCDLDESLNDVHLMDKFLKKLKQKCKSFPNEYNVLNEQVHEKPKRPARRKHTNVNKTLVSHDSTQNDTIQQDELKSNNIAKDDLTDDQKLLISRRSNKYNEFKCDQVIAICRMKGLSDLECLVTLKNFLIPNQEAVKYITNQPDELLRQLFNHQGHIHHLTFNDYMQARITLLKKMNSEPNAFNVELKLMFNIMDKQLPIKPNLAHDQITVKQSAPNTATKIINSYNALMRQLNNSNVSLNDKITSVIDLSKLIVELGIDSNSLKLLNLKALNTRPLLSPSYGKKLYDVALQLSKASKQLNIMLSGGAIHVISI